MEYASIASSTIEFSLKTIKCPECKKKRVWQDPSCGEFVCCSCGIVINENEILGQYFSKKRGRRKPAD